MRIKCIKILFLLILVSLLAPLYLSSTVITISNEGFAIKNDEFSLSTNPLKIKLSKEYFEIGEVGTKGLDAVLFNPYIYNFDNTVPHLSIGSLEGLGLRLRYKHNSLLFMQGKRTTIGYTFCSKYFSFIEAVFLKGDSDDALFSDNRAKSDIDFSRLFLTFSSKYFSLFGNLDYNIDLGLYTDFGMQISYKNYFINYIYGDSLTGLNENKLKMEFSFGLKESCLSCSFKYDYGDMPLFLDQFRPMGFKYDIEVRLAKVTIKRVGESSFSNTGKYSEKEKYKITTAHYEAVSDESFYIKVRGMKFGIKDGYSSLSWEGKIKDDRELGFKVIMLKECSLYFKIHL